MRIRMLVGLSLGCLIGLAAIASYRVSAQTPGPQKSPAAAASPPGTGANPQATPEPGTSQNVSQATSAVATAAPKVVRVDGHLELDEIIGVEVDHFAEWATKNDPTKLVPFINGRAVRGNYPEEIHPDANRLHFHLEITPANKELWTDLLGAPPGTSRMVTFSVGLENQSPFDSFYDQNHEIPLTVISPIYGVVSLLVVLLTLILFLWLARKTNLIREKGPKPVGGKLRPYNLGRTQMAFWFFLVYMSYLVIWLITNALDTITPSLLGLMGISAGTALGEALIDSGKDQAQSGQLQDLTAEQHALEQSIEALQAQLAGLVAKTALTPEEMANRDSLNKQVLDSRTRLAQVNQQVQALARPASTETSRGFLRDILSDSSGYSFHRFQIFAWTIVLGIIFVSSVYNNLTMPEFSPTLLGLMGLSSGTYIGFKFPEKR
ncbi:MAG: hypothetical protein JWM21_1894 [Acidobacteria bacterium]|nr:hypothetical protein [Acidobacteriota bacterium]